MPKQGLNLLQPSKEPKTAWEKIFDWTLGIGRIIVIGTQFVVLGALFARFILDRRNNDLKEEINAKVAILESQKEMEQTIRTLQADLTVANKLTDEQPQNSVILQGVQELLPDDVQITSVSVRADTFTVSGKAKDYTALKALEGNFRDKTDYKSVRVLLKTEKGEYEEVEEGELQSLTESVTTGDESTESTYLLFQIDVELAETESSST